MFKYATVGLMVVALALAGPAPTNPEFDCKNADVVSCYAVKAISAMNRLARSAKVELFDGAISVVRETPVERTSRALKTSEEILADLPQQPAEKVKTLAVQLIDTAANLMQNKVEVNPVKAAARFFGPVVTETIGAVADEINHKHHSIETKTQRILYKILSAIGPYMGTAITVIFAKFFLIGKAILLIGAFFLFQKFFETTGLLAYLSSFFQPANFAPVNPWGNNYASATNFFAQPPVFQPSNNYYQQIFDKVSAEIPTDGNTLTQN